MSSATLSNRRRWPPRPPTASACWNAFQRISDPRGPRGVRHTLASLLALASVAVLAGSRSFAAIGEWIAEAPAQVMAVRGVRRDPLSGHWQPPDESTCGACWSRSTPRLREGGADVAQVQALLGHASLDTSARYFRAGTAEQAAVVDRVFD
ncbi:transposase family protein [Nonomuraea sp. H19]|uniref:transposase family protein n=1 Tax=Nonomuraea sp. H19 TaxID=3452206 RepID=UPI003F8996D8